MPPLPVAAFGVVDEFAYGPAAPFLRKPADFLGDGSSVIAIGGTYAERCKSVSFLLTAVGGVTLRQGVVSFLDEGGVVFSAACSPFTVAAGKASQLTFAVGANNGGANDAAAIVTSLPPIFLQPGYSIQLTISGGVVADTVEAVRVLTDRFSTAPQEYAPGQGGNIARVEDAGFGVPVGIIGGN